MSEILRLHRVDFGRRVAWLDPGTTKNGDGRGNPLNAHLAPEHLSQAAGRIERNWEIVQKNPTISLR